MKTNKEKFLSYKELIKILDYNPKTGIFTWKVDRTNGQIKAGTIAGTIHKKSGYIVIGINKKYHYVQRLAWFYMTGKWPKQEVDHKDLNKSNNRWKNLREATINENHYNKSLQKNNTSGYKGVCFHKPSKKFIAKINYEGKNMALGYYKTAKEASLIYCKAAKKLHKDFARIQ
jgi:hypothetical protein